MIYGKLASLAFIVQASASSSPAPTAEATCRDLKSAYQTSSCCGADLSQSTHFVVSPPPPPPMAGANPCAGTKPTNAGTAGFPDTPQPYFYNTNCTLADGVTAVLEQAGANITAGYVGDIDAVGGGRTPITTEYYEAGLCPVNVHWHLGAEHYSAGQFDEAGSGPGSSSHRRLASSDSGPRQGFQCHHYDSHDAQYTTPYDWKYCQGMEVGQTYEVHWPHSKAGACGTPNQYQSPFYDGVFCTPGIITLSPLNTWTSIGVQGQVFTIVNNESYYYPDMIRGAINDGDMWHDVAKYTGSTTGTSRHNEVCSRFTPITWQVDRTCHKISASSFDKMCQDMLAQRDDMSGDLHAHGSRTLVADHLAANNLVRRD